MTHSVINAGDELLGDFTAPVGTRLWCIYVRNRLQQMLNDTVDYRDRIEGFLQPFIQAEGWKQLTNEHDRPFRTYSEFCQTRYPYGLGMAPEAIDQIIADAKRSAQEIAADPEVKPIPANGEVGKGRSSNDIRPNQHGTSVDYLVRRLKRDAPEIADALGRGEFPSARAAGIAAGIIKVPTPLERIRKEWAKLNDEERAAFLEEISDQWLAAKRS